MAPRAEQALVLAEEAALDLVEVAPAANPPVCRIMDYGKFKYEEKKKKAAGKSKGSAELKELKLRPGTDEHDLHFKMKQARKFLMEGDKVKVTVMFRGREMVHRSTLQSSIGSGSSGDRQHGEIARMERRFLSIAWWGTGKRSEAKKSRPSRQQQERSRRGGRRRPPPERGSAGDECRDEDPPRAAIAQETAREDRDASMGSTLHVEASRTNRTCSRGQLRAATEEDRARIRIYRYKESAHARVTRRHRPPAPQALLRTPRATGARTGDQTARDASRRAGFLPSQGAQRESARVDHPHQRGGPSTGSRSSVTASPLPAWRWTKSWLRGGRRPQAFEDSRPSPRARPDPGARVTATTDTS